MYDAENVSSFGRALLIKKKNLLPANIDDQ